MLLEFNIVSTMRLLHIIQSKKNFIILSFNFFNNYREKMNGWFSHGILPFMFGTAPDEIPAQIVAKNKRALKGLHRDSFSFMKF